MLNREKGIWSPTLMINKSKVEIEPFDDIETSFTYIKIDDLVTICARFRFSNEKWFDPSKFNGEWEIGGIPFIPQDKYVRANIFGASFCATACFYAPNLILAHNKFIFDVDAEFYEANKIKMISSFCV